MLNNEASFPRYVEVQRTASAGISNVRIEEATSRRSSTTRRWVGGGEWAEVRVVPKMDGRGRRWFTCNLRLEKGKAKVDYVHKVRPARSLGCPPLRLGMEKEKQKHREKRNSRAPEAGASASWRLIQWPQVIGWAFHPNPTLPADVRGSYELFKRGGAGAAKGAMPPRRQGSGPENRFGDFRSDAARRHQTHRLHHFQCFDQRLREGSGPENRNVYL